MNEVTPVQTKNKFIPALGYDWLTGFYDLAVNLTMPEREFRTQLIDKLAPQNGDAILEFGFGTGQNLIFILLRGIKANLIGVDIDPRIKAIAEQKMRKLGFFVPLDLYDGETFAYADNSFDKVFSSLVFHQLTKEEKLSSLKEIYRVLKPGGKLIIGDWGQARSPLMRLAFYAVQIIDGFKTTNDNVNGLLPRFIEQAEFKNVIESGFINTKIGTYCYYSATK